MARKTKFQVVTINQPEQQTYTKELAIQIAREVAKEVTLELLKSGTFQPGIEQNIDEKIKIKLDESIIPVDVNMNIESKNTEKLGKEEKHIDKELEKAKNKLATMFMKRE